MGSVLKDWIEQEADLKSVTFLQQELGISSFLADLLVQRGLHDPSDAEQFLKPKLKHLEDPFAIKNMVVRFPGFLRRGKRRKGFYWWEIMMWTGSPRQS